MVAVPAERLPTSAVNVTGTPGTPAPLTSSTRAAMLDVPPAAASVCGVALKSTRSTAADPTRRFSSRAEAPPENAVTVAVPLWAPAISRTRTWPLFVRASDGSIRPTVVVKLMTVPLWTGVPEPCVDVPVGVVGVVGVPGVPGVVGGGVVGGAVAVPFSMAVATISISPLSGTVFDDGNSVMTVPLGASSGTLSHEEATRMSGTAATIDAARSIPGRCRSCASIEGAKDNTLMGLAGQDIGRWERGQRGYAMAALLIALAVMAIVMSVAMPVWRHEALREKEAELVWRGEQYARAIALFRAKNSQNPNMLPRASTSWSTDGTFGRNTRTR